MEIRQQQLSDARTQGGMAFVVLSRLGLVARGAIYAIIGVLAIQVAVHSRGAPADQRGALETIDHQPFGHVLLIATAVGLGGYALWRLAQAWHGHGPEGGGENSAGYRIAAFASGCAYAAMCALAVSILIRSASSSSSPQQSTAGVLGWPGGREIVAAAGIVFVGVALFQGYRGVSRKFLDEDKTEQMGRTTRRWFTRIGVVGHLARMVAFGLIGTFVIKAAVDYSPQSAVGLDGALEKLARQTYGTFLLAVVAAGLIAFGVYSIAEARYRRI